ncbi:hypothetical protein AVEN_27333-1 [Araneus ventricosus]|uniref:Uncharacterized protein n=1 Tax=Araneus ventricosus TaxID=182803 RepID=A0A4Y2GL46_ARAVE|nr:hypothetical protein AVEN_27333-1 [Araneus ventricosus]
MDYRVMTAIQGNRAFREIESRSKLKFLCHNKRSDKKVHPLFKTRLYRNGGSYDVVTFREYMGGCKVNICQASSLCVLSGPFTSNPNWNFWNTGRKKQSSVLKTDGNCSTWTPNWNFWDTGRKKPSSVLKTDGNWHSGLGKLEIERNKNPTPHAPIPIRGLERGQRFAKAGFFVSNENSASKEDEDDIPIEELNKMWIKLREKEEINDNVLIDDFLSRDSEAETSETLTELDILDSAKKKKIQQ